MKIKIKIKIKKREVKKSGENKKKLGNWKLET